MLGLRLFECRHCTTVYAGPDAPPRCDNCAGEVFKELTGHSQAEAYFAGRR